MAKQDPSGGGFVPLSVFADNPLYLAPENYPNGDWSERHGAYNEYWAAYKGFELSKRAGNGHANDPLVYPFKLNIIRPSVIMHAAGLLGQYEDKIVKFGIPPSELIDKSVAKETSLAMNMLWSINNGDASMIEAALFQQIFGGFYLQAMWTPNRKKWPIRYYVIDPRAVFPIWDGYDYSRLISVDIMHQIPKVAASARYGTISGGFVNTSSEVVNVHEHWDENEYWIEFDGKVGTWADGSKMKGKNPWYDPIMGHTIIPVSYAPRIRSGTFYGDSLIPGLTAPQRELNSSIAGLEDGLLDAMYQIPWVRNSAKGLQNIKSLTSRQDWLNLGMTNFNGDPPEVGRLNGAEIQQPMVDFVMQDMVELIREHNGMPNVAWGRNNASVRSALVLAFMMKPYADMARMYRINAADALKHHNYNALVIAYNKQKFGDIGVKVSDAMFEAIHIGHKTYFPPILPQDRVDLVNEVVQRIASGAMSIESAISRLDGDDDLTEELERIKKQKDEEQKRAMELGKIGAMKQGNNNETKQTSNRKKAEGGTAAKSKEK